MAWPLFKWFKARLPEKLAFGVTFLALLAVLALFFGLLFYSGKVMADAAPRYADEAAKMWGQARESAARYDLTLPENPRQLLKGSGGTSFVGPLLSILGLWLLVIGLVALGLHEAPTFRAKFQKRLMIKPKKARRCRFWIKLSKNVVAISGFALLLA